MLTIDRYWQNALLMVALVTLWLAVAGGSIWLLAQDTLKNPVPLEWLKLGVCAAILLGILAFLLYYFGCRVVFRAEIGEEIALRTLFGERRVRWQEVGRLNVKTLAGSMVAKVAVHWILTDGRRYVLWANESQADEVYRLAAAKPLARDWPGLPMDGGVMFAVLLLGIVALGFGLFVDVALLTALMRPQPNNAMGVGGIKTFGLAVAAAIGLPLLGSASTLFAAYHLWRRPIMVRPGLVRTSEADAPSLRGLFGSQE